MRGVPEPAKFGKQLPWEALYSHAEGTMSSAASKFLVIKDTNPRTKGQPDGEEAKPDASIKTTVSCDAQSS